MSESHINDGVRSALAEQTPEIRRGVLAVANRAMPTGPNVNPPAPKPPGTPSPAKPPIAGR